MINSVYLCIHQRLKELQDNDGLIERKEILHALQHQPHLQEHIREIVIRELVELGLLQRVNSQTYRWIPNKNSDNIFVKAEAQKMAAFHRKTWWTPNSK